MSELLIRLLAPLRSLVFTLVWGSNGPHQLTLVNWLSPMNNALRRLGYWHVVQRYLTESFQDKSRIWDYIWAELTMQKDLVEPLKASTWNNLQNAVTGNFSNEPTHTIQSVRKAGERSETTLKIWLCIHYATHVGRSAWEHNVKNWALYTCKEWTHSWKCTRLSSRKCVATSCLITGHNRQSASGTNAHGNALKSDRPV